MVVGIRRVRQGRDGRRAGGRPRARSRAAHRHPRITRRQDPHVATPVGPRRAKDLAARSREPVSLIPPRSVEIRRLSKRAFIHVAVAQLGACRSSEKAEPRAGVLRASNTSSKPNARRETGLGDAPGSYATATHTLDTLVLRLAAADTPRGRWRDRPSAAPGKRVVVSLPRTVRQRSLRTCMRGPNAARWKRWAVPIVRPGARMASRACEAAWRRFSRPGSRLRGRPVRPYCR